MMPNLVKKDGIIYSINQMIEKLETQLENLKENRKNISKANVFQDGYILSKSFYEMKHNVYESKDFEFDYDKHCKEEFK